MNSLPDLPDERHRAQSWHDDDPSPLAQQAWPQQRASTNLQRAAKAARVHTLTDPLGTKGFRVTGPRVRAEASARRKVLLASVATFAASFGIIVATNHTPTNASPSASTPPAAVSSGQVTSSPDAASVGAAADAFTSQTAKRLISSATITPTATSAVPQQVDTPNDDLASGDNTLLPTQTSDASSNQSMTSSQPTQAPLDQQPSHTRSGGS